MSLTVSTTEYRFTSSSLARPGAVRSWPTPVLTYYIKGSIRTTTRMLHAQTALSRPSPA